MQPARKPRRRLARPSVPPAVLLAAAVAAAGLLAPPASAQVRTWTGAGTDDLWFNAANWDTGVPDTAAESAVVGAPSPTILNGTAAIGGLTVQSGGVLTFNPDTLLGVAAGTVANSGTITLGTAVNNAVAFRLDGDLSLTGTGTFTLNGVNARVSDDTNGFTRRLTVGTGQTVNGYGVLGQNQIVFTNNGLIDASVLNATLNLDAAAGTNFNTGTLRASAGTLALAAGAFDNTGGTVAAAGTGAVQFQNGFELQNGTVAAATGTGTYNVTSGTAGFTGVTNNGAVGVNSDTAFAVTTGLTNNGTVTIGQAVNNAAGFVLRSDVALNGSGTLSLNGVNARVSDDTNSLHLRPHQRRHAHRSTATACLGAEPGPPRQQRRDRRRLGRQHADARRRRRGQHQQRHPPRLRRHALARRRHVRQHRRHGRRHRQRHRRLPNGFELQNGNVAAGSGTYTVASGTVGFTDVVSGANIGLNSDTTLAVTNALTNNGTITVGQAVNNTAGFTVRGDVTLGGTGTLSLNGVNAIVSDATSSFTRNLTIGAGQTVNGFGRFGDNQITFANNGLIDAGVTGQTLAVDSAGSATSFNPGTIRASSGTLALRSGTYDNTGGTIEAQAGGTLSLESAADITGGTVGGTGTIAVTGGAVDFTSVTSTGSISVNNDTTLGVTTALANNGTVTIGQAVNNAAGFVLRSDVALTGSGTLSLNGVNARVSDDTSAFTRTLTNAAGHTIAGYGRLGDNQINLANAGVIDADVANTTLTLDIVGSTNTGTLRATAGTLALAAGTIDSDGGTISSSGTGTLTFASGFELQNGTITAGSTGTVVSGTAGFTDVTNNGAITVNSDSVFAVTNTLTNNGAITVGPGNVNNSVGFVLRGDVTLGGTGTVMLNGVNARVSDESSAFTRVLTNAAGHTFNGFGQLGVNQINIVNAGLVIGDAAGKQLQIDAATSFANTGTIRASGGGLVRLGNGLNVLDNTGGTIEALAGSEVFTLGTGTSGSDISNFTVADKSLNGGTYRAVGGSLSIAPSNFDLAINRANLEFSGQAQTDLFDAAPGASTPGALTSAAFANNAAGATLRLDDNLSLTTTAAFTNNGTLTVVNGATFAAPNTTNNGTIFGTGTVAGPVTNNGTVAPGDGVGGVGTLSLNGDYLQSRRRHVRRRTERPLDRQTTTTCWPSPGPRASTARWT